MPIDIPIHPMLVHFPIALLITGFAAELAGLLTGKEWLTRAALLLLILGTAGAISAVVTGQREEDKIVETPAIEHTLEEHEEAGEFTMWLFIAIAAARIVTAWRKSLPKAVSWVVLLVWLAGLGAITKTAWHGGHLVYKYGAGVAVIGSEGPVEPGEMEDD